jgi:hypothetical protein
MNTVRTALKGAVFVLAALVPAVVLTLQDWAVSGHEAANLAVLGVGSAAVWFKSNTAAFPAARAVLAIFVVVADTLVAAWTDQVIDSAELTTIITAFLGAVGLWLAGDDETALTSGPSPRGRSLA